MNPAVVVRVPSSKSVTHRAFLLAAQSEVPCRVLHPLLGADCRSTLAVLAGLGARFTIEGPHVQFQPIDAWRAPEAPLDCGNSGTTLRLMTGQAATAGFPVTLTGDASLQSRPNEPLLAALRGLGAHTSAGAGGAAPLTVCGPLVAEDVTLPARTSSQYASAILLAAAMHVPGSTKVCMRRPVASRPYLDITLEVAGAFGLCFGIVEGDAHLVFSAPGAQRPKATAFEVEGDWSGAAFPLMAGALLGVPVTLTGLRRDSSQGDAVVVALLRRFGLAINWVGEALELQPTRLVGAGTIDLGAAPDLFPALVALASRAAGETTFVNAPSLRHKECDRITAMSVGLSQLAIENQERPDGLWVRGGPPKGGAQIASHHDHRVHMAFAILGAETAGITVDAHGCEAVSYPNFYADLARISG